MNEQQYYKQIKELIETYEVNSKVRYLQDNHEKLLTNWKIGKILVEVQGGLKNGLIYYQVYMAINMGIPI